MAKLCQRRIFTRMRFDKRRTTRYREGITILFGYTDMASLAPSSGMFFGFRWSLVGCVTALFYIASCDLFIPPDRSVPRYNTVRGAAKRPALNPGGEAYRPSANTQVQRERTIDDAYGSGSTAPIQGATAMPMAPLPATQGQARPIGPRSDIPNESAERRAQREEESGGFWSSLAFWSDDAEEAKPAVRPQPQEVTSGTGPAAPTAPVAAADLAPPAVDANGYPVLSETPPAPGAAVIEDAQRRAIAAQSELNAGRQGAVQMQGQVAAEAAAEPSLLSTRPELKTGPVPGPQSRAVPLENPSPAMLSDAGAAAPMAAQPVVVRGTVPSLPTGGAMEPIRLTPPGGAPDAGVAGATGSATNGGAPAPGTITLAAPPSRYSGSRGYLPESRYSQRNPARLTGPYATVQ